MLCVTKSTNNPKNSIQITKTLYPKQQTTPNFRGSEHGKTDSKWTLVEQKSTYNPKNKTPYPKPRKPHQKPRSLMPSRHLTLITKDLQTRLFTIQHKSIVLVEQKSPKKS